MTIARHIHACERSPNLPSRAPNLLIVNRRLLSLLVTAAILAGFWIMPAAAICASHRSCGTGHACCGMRVPNRAAEPAANTTITVPALAPSRGLLLAETDERGHDGYPQARAISFFAPLASIQLRI
jgi:hypothetical protein